MKAFRCDEFDWNELLMLIEYKKVIPVIGQGLSFVKTEENGKIPLYDFLTQQVAQNCGVAISSSTGHKFAETCSKFIEQTQNNYQALSDFFKKTLAGVSLIPFDSLWKLAHIKNFNIFLTTAYDDFLVEQIKEVRKVPSKALSYSVGEKEFFLLDNKLFDDLKHSHFSLVYHMFGKLENLEPSYTKSGIRETMREFLKDMEINYQNNLFREMKNSCLLFMGFGYNDWILQSFIPELANRFSPFHRNQSTHIFIGGIPGTVDTIMKSRLYKLLKDCNVEVVCSCEPEIFIEQLFEQLEKKHSEVVIPMNETSPPDILIKRKKGKKEYELLLEKGEIKPLNEVKVLLVGEGGSGKTSLSKILLKQKFDKNEPSTEGINIGCRIFKKDKTEVKAHIWDFGGQEIKHATHRFFFSKRSLYILVLDSRRDEKPDYWLTHVESLGGNSPVLVVLNKIDENPGFEVNRKSLKEKYKNIKSFHRVSCKTSEGINGFINALERALGDVEIFGTTWPVNWFNVKKKLENMTGPYISYKEYRVICDVENIKEESNQKKLLGFLHDLGVVLHFRDFGLKDTNVLEPTWVTDAVYKIINSRLLAKSKGILDLNLLDEILKDKADFHFPPEKQQYIIKLMKKFDLCFEIDSEHMLIPDRLDIKECEFEFDYKKSVRLIFEYNLLPWGVMSLLIVRMHRDIKEKLCWRTGVVLEDKIVQSTAVIKADYASNRIYIYVAGEQKRDYLSAILFNIRQINQSFEKLETTKLVPMPDEPKITVGYLDLIRLEKNGIEFYLPGKSEKKYRVKDLLGSIIAAETTEEQILSFLKKLVDDNDTKESLLNKVNHTLILQPKIFGVGFDINNLIKKVLRWNKKRKNCNMT